MSQRKNKVGFETRLHSSFTGKAPRWCLPCAQPTQRSESTLENSGKPATHSWVLIWWRVQKITLPKRECHFWSTRVATSWEKVLMNLAALWGLVATMWRRQRPWNLEPIINRWPLPSSVIILHCSRTWTIATCFLVSRYVEIRLRRSWWMYKFFLSLNEVTMPLIVAWTWMSPIPLI